MTFAQQEPSAKAPCTRTMVLIAMILLLRVDRCFQSMPTNVAVVHAGTIERERAFGQLNEVKRRRPVQAA
jgi:hypothetical protein